MGTGPVPARNVGRVMEKPKCNMGYTRAQLARILGIRLPKFDRWMRGQTGAVCEGNGKCKAVHGFIVYPHDLQQFLDGRMSFD